MYCCHVNNIAYLLKNHRTNALDMRNIIESLSPEERRKYDYDLLEEKYLENQNRIVDDDAVMEQLEHALANREVVLIAPGKNQQYRLEADYRIYSENQCHCNRNQCNQSNYTFDYLCI